MRQQQGVETAHSQPQNASVAPPQGVAPVQLPAASTGWTGAAAAPQPLAPAAQAEWMAATARADAWSGEQKPPPTADDAPEKLVARPAGYPPGPGVTKVVSSQARTVKQGRTTKPDTGGGAGDWGGAPGTTDWDTPTLVAAGGGGSRHADSGSMDVGIHAPPVGVQPAPARPAGVPPAGRGGGAMAGGQAGERTSWLAPSNAPGGDDGWDRPPAQSPTAGSGPRAGRRSSRDNDAAVAAAHAQR